VYTHRLHRAVVKPRDYFSEKNHLNATRCQHLTFSRALRATHVKDATLLVFINIIVLLLYILV